MLTPLQMLAVLDDAIVRAPRGRKAIALELRGSPVVLGQSGKYLHTEPADVDGDPEAPVYGFTKAQCIAMREAIVAAAREDAAGA